MTIEFNRFPAEFQSATWQSWNLKIAQTETLSRPWIHFRKRCIKKHLLGNFNHFFFHGSNLETVLSQRRKHAFCCRKFSANMVSFNLNRWMAPASPHLTPAGGIPCWPGWWKVTRHTIGCQLSWRSSGFSERLPPEPPNRRRWDL